MDPDTCFSMILDSIAGEEWIGAAQHAENLRTWLSKRRISARRREDSHRLHQRPARVADLPSTGQFLARNASSGRRALPPGTPGPSPRFSVARQPGLTYPGLLLASRAP